MDQYRWISLYWKCQLSGWTVACLYWTYAGYEGTQFSWSLAAIHLVLDLSMYISLSHAYRKISLAQQWHLLSAKKLIPRLIPAAVLLGLAFMFLTVGKNWFIRILFETGFDETFTGNLHRYALTTFVTGVRLMSIWLLAYYAYHFAQRERRAIKESNRLSIIAREATFNNLSNQLNPHFFFNSLNSIKALIIENPVAARRAIDLLSDLLRTSLYERNKDLITVADEMTLIADYLELEKIRFEKKLHAVVEVEEEVYSVLILPLSIQVLVENAIKHGIAGKIEGGTIYISLKRKNGQLVVIVKNDGKLGDKINTGLGLKNLAERLTLHYNGHASFNIEEKDKTIFATLTIPLP